MEKLSANTSRDRDATLMQQLTQALLRTLEAGDSNILTSSDVGYLTQMIEADRMPSISADNAKADTVDMMVSIATNYVKLASLMLEPSSAHQWSESTEVVRDIMLLSNTMIISCKRHI